MIEHYIELKRLIDENKVIIYVAADGIIDYDCNILEPWKNCKFNDGRCDCCYPVIVDYVRTNHKELTL